MGRPGVPRAGRTPSKPCYFPGTWMPQICICYALAHTVHIGPSSQHWIRFDHGIPELIFPRDHSPPPFFKHIVGTQTDYLPVLVC